MPLSNVQKGAIGQFAFLSTALATGRGDVEAYVPVADNERRDAEIRRHLKSTPGITVRSRWHSVSLLMAARTANI
jgi:hypothetical protein